jgi:hypothetical protein
LWVHTKRPAVWATFLFETHIITTGNAAHIVSKLANRAGYRMKLHADG